MTWHFDASIADAVHRVRNEDGTIRWGIEHRGFDDSHESVQGVAEVVLPTGETELLLVDPLPGGLVLDVVRSFHGLTDSEVRTLVSGCIDELSSAVDAPARLGLECFGLDAEGRPRLIPGVRHPQETSVRRAVGELIYHAAHGAAWATSLAPIGIALADCGEELRVLVTDLFDESGTRADAGLAAVLAEVAPRLRTLPAPVALPMVPDAEGLDPALALTARLRAPHPPRRGTDAAGQTGAESGDSARTGETRRSSPRTPLERIRGLAPGASAPAHGAVVGLRDAVTSRGARTVGIVAAMVLVLTGGLLMVRAWSATDPAATQVEAGAKGVRTVEDAEIASRLGELCLERAEALAAADATALAALTVPDSTAAAADELLDLSAYAGGTYAIDVADVAVTDRSGDAVTVTATMTTSAEAAGERASFETKDVVFTLRLHEGQWRIAEVADRP